MHTGHSVYGTFHAEQAYEVVDRITSPPMEIPGQVMKSLHLIVVQYRNRRTGQRRTFEITELTKEGEGNKPGLNTLFKWQPKSDVVEPLYSSVRIKDELELFGGLTEKETQEDLTGKKDILKWMLDKDIKNVNDVGKIVAQYYLDRNVVLDAVRGNKPQI
jgi:flagellar protein FlaI